MAYIRAKGRIIFGSGTIKVFEIADLGSDIINYWNVDTGKTTYNTATKISEWNSLYGQQSKLSQADANKQLIQYYINGRTDHLALQPSWASAENWMSTILTTPVSAPWTRYFAFVGPSSNGDQYIFGGTNSLSLYMSTTTLGISLPGAAGVSISTTYRGEVALPLDNIGWHIMAWCYDGYNCHRIYLDDPVEPWAALSGDGTSPSFSKVSFFNEGGGTAWWNNIGDLLDCKSVHNVTTRTNVMNVLKNRFLPSASTPISNWTPLSALSANLTAQYEVSTTGVVMSTFTLQDGDMSYVDASKWSKYNCTAVKVAGGPPIENVTNKVIRVTNTGAYGCISDSMYNVTAGCWYRISGWVKRGTNSSAPWIDFANNTAVWTGASNAGTWEKFDFVVKAPTSSGPTFRTSVYNTDTCDWANLKVECLSVRQLLDLSGKGNHLISSSDLTSPIYSRSQTGRGNPGIKFDGVDDILKGAFTVSSTGTAHIFMAFKHNGNASGTVYDGYGRNELQLYYNVTGPSLRTYAGGYGPIQNYTTSTWTCLDVVWKAGTNETKIGVKGGAFATGTTTPVFNGFCLGGSVTLYFANMVFYGGFISNRELTADERANAVAYYKDRIGDYYY